MESFRSNGTSINYNCQVDPLNPSRNTGIHLDYSDTLYSIPNTQSNPIFTNGTPRPMIYPGSNRNIESLNPNYIMRRNASVPGIYTRNMRRTESNRSGESLSANRYPIPQRQLSVPTISNINLSNRQSEILRIHQELSRYHNSLQNRLRNSPRFVYQPNSPSSNQISNGNDSSRVPILVVNNLSQSNVFPENNLISVRRNNSLNTRTYTRNNSSVTGINSNQIISGPTQSINLVEPVEIGLPQQIIESFPLDNFRDSSDELDDNLRSCSVCLEEFIENDQIRRLPCTHVYHINCIDPWLRKNTRCPICKFDYIIMIQI